jgi:diguanylate cyclase (GGDEF)-like protein
MEVIDGRQMDHLRVFHDVARTLTTSLELDEILHAIMEKMANFFGPERWSLLIVDGVRKDLYYAIAVGEDADSLKGFRVPLGHGVAGWVAATGNPLVIPSVSLDPQWSAFARENPDLKIESIACLPIRSGGETLGVIQLLNSKLDLMSDYSISFLRILCDYAAIAIGNARSVERIHELTITDDCTGLFNSRRLYTRLEELVSDTQRGEPTPFSLVFMDLDHFKAVNDRYGHLVGSRLLAEVGGLVRRAAGPENEAFRYGGDEFCVLLPECSKDRAIEVTRALLHGLRRHRFLTGEGLELQVTGSFGLATYPEDGATVHAMLRSADTMMYEVKNSTRDDLAVKGLERGGSRRDRMFGVGVGS